MATEFPGNANHSFESESNLKIPAAAPSDNLDSATSDQAAESLDNVLKNLDSAVAQAFDPPSVDYASGATVHLPSVEPHPVPDSCETGTEDDEISIEQYMKSLLERTRGSSTNTTESDAASAQQPQADPSSSDAAKESAGDDCPTTDPQPESNENAEPAHVHKQPPERPETIDHFRDVANLSANQAISSYSGKKLAAKSRDTLLTAMVLQVTSFAIIATTPQLHSTAYYAAIAAFVVSSYWTMRFAGLTQRLKQVVARMQTDTDDSDPPEADEANDA